MATATQTPDLSSGMVGTQPSSPSQPPSQPPSTPALDPLNLSTGTVGSQSEDPSQTGYLTNDVGNRVIVPKDGESFSDTVKRAIQYHKSLTPEQQQDAMQREVATMPEKTAETLGAAAGIGVLGPAALASPLEIHALMGAGIKALTPALISGTVAVGEWAEAHPIAAKTIMETLKMVLAGTIAGKVADHAKRVINANPD